MKGDRTLSRFDNIDLNIKLFPMVSLILLSFVGRPSLADQVQVVTEGPNVGCRKFEFMRELAIYKDPSIFLSNLALLYVNPMLGWKSLRGEDPLITRIKGPAYLAILGPQREFRNFGAISKIYELARKREQQRAGVQGDELLESGPTFVFPLKICKNPDLPSMSDSYAETLGIAEQKAFQLAEVAETREGAGRPPSTPGNPIYPWNAHGHE